MQDDGLFLGLAHWIQALSSLFMSSVLVTFPRQIAASSQAESSRQTRRCRRSVLWCPHMHTVLLAPMASVSVHHKSTVSHSLSPLLVPGDPVPQSSLKGPNPGLLCPRSSCPLDHVTSSSLWTWQLYVLATDSCFPSPLFLPIGENLLIRGLQPSVILRQPRTWCDLISKLVSSKSFWFLMLT